VNTINTIVPVDTPDDGDLTSEGKFSGLNKPRVALQIDGGFSKPAHKAL
jgi:hypothetical protein